MRPAFGGNSNSTIRDFVDGTSNSILVGEVVFECSSGRISPWACVQHAGTGVVFTGGLNRFLAGSSTTLANYSQNASSSHTGGAHVLLGDGGVRFLSQNINQTTLNYLAYIADNNVIGEF